MSILAVGVSHRRATVELLERLAFTDDDLAKAYRRAADDGALEESVIVSTCNRVEIYASVPGYHGGFLALKRLLCESRGVAEEDLADPLYSHYEDDAAEHLFRVASGLDSMVLGEPQILSQVREAHRRAETEGAARGTLTALFQAAARAGRRVRAETRIGAAPDAFVRAGADLAADGLGGLAGRSAVVVGAGQMAALAVRHLRERSVGTVRVLNRSLERARVLAERHDAEHEDLRGLPRALAGADLVVTATGAAGLVIREDAVREAMRDRERPMFFLDLAVPRDVEPSVTEVPAVRLVDIDGLRRSLAAREEEIAGDIGRAHEIVADEVRRFAVRRRSEHLAPLIRALRARGDEVLFAELSRYRHELSGLEPKEREAVQALARGIVSKLLHDPVVRLKELAEPGTEQVYAKLLADLFGIEPETAESA
jgi:glutamyl-tRNA reductase